MRVSGALFDYVVQQVWCEEELKNFKWGLRDDGDRAYWGCEGLDDQEVGVLLALAGGEGGPTGHPGRRRRGGSGCGNWQGGGSIGHPGRRRRGGGGCGYR